MSNPYYYLRNAVNHRSGVCSAWDVRRELEAYLEWQAPRERAWGKKFWSEIMTREEYQALCNRRKKRKPRRKKGESDPIKHVYTTVESEQLELRGHAPELDSEHVEDLNWIDALARQQNEEWERDAYWGEW